MPTNVARPLGSRPSAKQAGRQNLPHWLKGLVPDLLRAEAAVALSRPEVGALPGHDVHEGILRMVSEASGELSARCRQHLLGLALAPHARWESPPDDEPQEAIAPTVADLERQLRELADAGDRSAILAMLAALDPARYGPPGKVLPPGDHTVDTVDFTPAITSKA
jgi:hypothetical protein